MDCADIPTAFSLGTFAFCMAAFAVAGFIDAIAGGGGLITTPSLLIAGLPPHAALGTGKFASTIGSMTALATYLRNNLVLMRIVPTGFASSFVGAVAGAWMALLLKPDILGKIIVFMLPIGIAASLLVSRTNAEDRPLPGSLQSKVCITGLILGAYDGFFGPGTGSFLIIALNLLIHLDLVRASATSKVMNFASNIGAACTFANGGVIIYTLALPCVCASILGNLMGARLAIRVGTKAVRRFLYVTLTMLLTTLVYKFFLI